MIEYKVIKNFTPLSKRKTLTAQKGLSLIELMIALTLGLFLIFGVMQVFISSKQTYRVQDGVSRMQENARFALDVMMQDLRNAGYVGCENLSSVAPNVVAASAGTDVVVPSYTTADVIKGYQSTATQTWTPTLPTTLTDIADNTDILTVASSGRCSQSITADMGSAGADIVFAAGNECGFSRNDVLIITDCKTADIFNVTNDVTGNRISHNTLSEAYTTANTSEILSFRSITYFIRDDAVSGVPSLYIFDNTKVAAVDTNPVALIEGVENLQVEYGIDSVGNDGVPETYDPASTTTTWENVVAVRLTLLMRTMEQVDGNAVNFNTGGTNVIYDDGVLRKEFTATVQIRNRGLN